MKYDGKKALICPICTKSIRGTGGTFVKEYRDMMYYTHLKKSHNKGNIIIT